MPAWTPFPHTGDYPFNVTRLRKNWSRLHAGDLEPLPKDPKVLRAWVLFHSGEFQRAATEGLQAGGAGITVANKATCIYATHLEADDKARLALFMEVAERASAQTQQEPDNVNAWYWKAYALGRYSQGISIARALAQGLGTRVKVALEKTIKLEPRHADAHIALGAFHAEVIDKVGTLIGAMTYGANRETGMKLYQTALQLNPNSAMALTEYANALLMMDGERSASEARSLFEQAAACSPLDAMQWLDVELAKAEMRQR